MHFVERATQLCDFKGDPPGVSRISLQRMKTTFLSYKTRDLFKGPVFLKAHVVMCLLSYIVQCTLYKLACMDALYPFSIQVTPRQRSP